MRSLAIPRGALYNRVLSVVLCRMILKRSFRSHIVCHVRHSARRSRALQHNVVVHGDGYLPDKVTDSRLRTLHVFTICAGPALSAATRPALRGPWLPGRSQLGRCLEDHLVDGVHGRVAARQQVPERFVHQLLSRERALAFESLRDHVHCDVRAVRIVIGTLRVSTALTTRWSAPACDALGGHATAKRAHTPGS